MGNRTIKQTLVTPKLQRNAHTIRRTAELKAGAEEARSALAWAKEAFERRDALITAAYRGGMSAAAILAVTGMTIDAVAEVVS